MRPESPASGSFLPFFPCTLVLTAMGGNDACDVTSNIIHLTLGMLFTLIADYRLPTAPAAARARRLRYVT